MREGVRYAGFALACRFGGVVLWSSCDRVGFRAAFRSCADAGNSHSARTIFFEFAALSLRSFVELSAADWIKR